MLLRGDYMIRMVDLIMKKRDSEVLTDEEIAFIIKGYVEGSIPDYQVSALLMAIYYQGLNDKEMTALTMSMLHSGEQIDLSPIKGIKVDKHSTGGVGDKTSLVVAPICAALGIKLAKMSGRGLGHTGGTLDKLESIPGFKIEISPEAFFEQVNKIGLAIIGQSANITPADKKLYALRDVTATVESTGLIASSVMSKKLASGADHIILDVKVGSGAFMKNIDDAKKLAQAMVKIGKNAGRDTVATLTDMEQPLGLAVGNALEVIEAIETLKGKGPKDFDRLCRALSAEVLLVSKAATSTEEAYKMVNQVIENGKALDKLRSMIEMQAGDSRVIDDYQIFAKAKFTKQVVYTGKEVQYVSHIDALEIGEAAMLLGAGRMTKDEAVDHAVGVMLNKKVGDMVKSGDIIATIHSNGKNTDIASEMVMQAYKYKKQEVIVNDIILDIVR